MTAAHGAPASILYAAFRRQLEPLLGRPEAVQRVLAPSLRPDRVLTASREGRPVALAGLHYAGRNFIAVEPAVCLRALGPARGALGWLVLNLFWAGECPPGQVRLAALAVDPAHRGRGLGSQLLAEVLDGARAGRYRAVRLEVLDTNAGARRLYERLGFAVVGQHRYPGLRRWLGFSSALIMTRPAASA